jgi:MFS transporter, FHS family, L-fucose permease
MTAKTATPLDQPAIQTSAATGYPLSSLITLISVFFFWGFVAASNTILIPIFKQKFELSQGESQFVDFAFYIAYFFGSLIYFFISLTAGDPLNKIGYKKGLILGLCISAAGSLGFVPAAAMNSFPLMLTSLFVVALGFALQQIVANPYVIALGNPATGSHRVSLAGGINSFGTTIGPLLLSFAIFGNISGNGTVALSDVKLPYLILCAAFLIFALILGISRLPAITNTEKQERDIGALRFPQLRWGMLAIFVYVGVEVSVQSNLFEFMKQPEILGLGSQHTSHFISLYWGSLMIGRWSGAITVFNPSKTMKNVLLVIVPLAAYAVILGVNWLKGSPMLDLLYYAPCVLLIIFGFFMSGDKPARTMIIFGVLSAIMLVAGILLSGKPALYCFISTGLFCSVMWPCIFSLSIAGLGKYTTQGSSLLIMMILGGAIIPPAQGYLSESIGIHLSYLLPLAGFAYLAFYGWKVRQVLRAQGIDHDAAENV